ncbi:MAG: hypothetical protein LJF06_11750 [Gemmatimonadetes bacterium]|nr:hypothetical protein [Gemmatimonadota bacterium]
MSWLAQVGHVLKKDVRQHRWMIVITLLALAGTVVEAMGWTAVSSPFPVNSLLHVVPTVPGAATFLLASFLLVAFVVQGDSPARSDAFWVPRPLSPSAVFVAKVVLIGFLAILLPAVWEVVAIGSHHLWSASVIGSMGLSVLVQTALLAAVAVVAALTPDLRTFLATFLVAYIGWSAAAPAIRQAVTGVSIGEAGLSPVEAVAWLLGGLALVAYQYRVRDNRHTLRVFALPTFLCLGLGAAFGGARPLAFGAGSTSEAVATPDLRIDSIRLERPPSWGGGRSWDAHVRMELVGGRSGYAYEVIAPKLRVCLPDGSHTTLRVRGIGQRLTNPWVPSVGLTWLGFDPTAKPYRPVVTFLVPTDLVNAVTDPRSRFAVEGRVYVQAPVEVGPLPMRVGATAVADGKRYRLLAFENDQGRPRVGVRYEGVESALRPTPWIRSSFDLTLVNAARQEAIYVRQSDNTSDSHNLVFMRERWAAGSLSLVPGGGGPDDQPSAVDDAWLDGAELHITDWVSKGSYRLATTPAAVDVRH